MNAFAFSELLQDLDCGQRYRELIGELNELSAAELRDIGAWRGAIPQIAAMLLGRQGCSGVRSKAEW